MPDKVRIATEQDAILNVFKQETKPRRKDEAAGQLNVEDVEMSLDWVQPSHRLSVI